MAATAQLPILKAPSIDQYADVTLTHKILYSGLSGCIATTCIYPIDCIKTQLMNQRNALQQNTIPKYTGPISCARYIVSTYGYKGLYKGYPPNVIFVFPEKALKLTLNDTFRTQFRNMSADKQTLTFGAEMAAGGLAGFIQVICTNPMELLKIKGATAANNATLNAPQFSYTQLIRSLGITGLYTGVVSTWLRDVPFSVIYFSTYSQAKNKLLTQDTHDSKIMPFVAGAIAGTTAAAITTPLDVIKTRVHAAAVRAKSGTFWSSELRLVKNTVHKLWINEGMNALFKGIVPRCLIISPLFGITMTCYEKFQSTFH